MRGDNNDTNKETCQREIQEWSFLEPPLEKEYHQRKERGDKNLAVVSGCDERHQVRTEHVADSRQQRGHF